MKAALASPPDVCEICHGRDYVFDRTGDRAILRVCACAEACRDCGGTGYLVTNREETFSRKVGPRTYEALAPCRCRVRARRIERFNRAGLPAVLSHAELDGFRAFNSQQNHARQIAAQFAQSYRPGGESRGFILSGPVGTGKTHLLVASLAHLMLEVGIETRYVEIALLYATIRRGFQENKSGGEIIGPLSEVEVLAIDELGKGRGSPFELDTLEELIARRYNAGRTTLFATNYSLEPERKATSHRAGYRTGEETKAAGSAPELLRERVGERIYSRLCELCEFVSLPPETPDHRRLRHEMVARPKPRARH